MLERIFKLNAKKTNVKTEVLAGITTFLAMAYILGVNPSILAGDITGMDMSSVFFQLIHYWRAIGFEEDANNNIHIPAYALVPAATGCYIKKEYLPKEIWVRIDMPYIYQLPITPLFGN